MKSSDEILAILQRPFPPDQIKTRDGGWNKEKKIYEQYKYVETEDITERLNEAFGLTWSLNISGVNGSANDFVTTDSGGDRHVVVGAEIEYKDPDTGDYFRRSGFGSKKITSEVGNDFKSSLSKALSNAAKKLGVAVDIGDDNIVSPEEASELKLGGSVKGIQVELVPKKPDLVSIKEEVAPANPEPKEENKGLVITTKVSSKTETKSIIDSGKALKSEAAASKIPAAVTDSSLACDVCTNQITESENKKTGQLLSPMDIIMLSEQFFQKKMCSDCMRVAKEKIQAKKAS